MSQKFEKKLENLKKEDIEIPFLVRHKVDVAYSKIKLSKGIKHRFTKKIMLSVVLLITLSIIIGISPITQAINYLKFGSFSSEKLREENFIVADNSHSQSKEIKISLEESYMDKKQIGLHFSISFPKNSKLLSPEINYYSLGFSVKDKSNILFSNDTNDGSMVGAYTQNQFFDKKNRTLEITYFLNNYQTEFLAAEDKQKIEITKITGTIQGNTKKVKQGFSHVETVTTEGKWELPLSTRNVENFPEIRYTGTIVENGELVKGQAFPTMFRVEIDPFEFAKNTTDIKLVSVKKGKVNEHKLLNSSSENGKLIWYFEYSDYDEPNEVRLQINNNNVATLSKSKS
ncbi:MULTISPECIES: hypothetical protein [Enterococcus]|uniref:hypothetical protein n=1 Tax=Enterococcus TaxID=1350 RepID=UPI0022E6D406|nr:hypothetical protein [Enterococcus thailandicus]